MRTLGFLPSLVLAVLLLSHPLLADDSVLKIEADLKRTREELVSVAGEIQKNEKELHRLEIATEDLEQEKMAIHQTMQKQRRSTSELILILGRMRRIPPEALIAKPGAPVKTAQAASLLGHLIPALLKKTESLNLSISRMEEVALELKEKKDKALAAGRNLERQQADLTLLLSQREGFYKEIHRDAQSREREAQRVSRRAANLGDLIENLDKVSPATKTDIEVDEGIFPAASDIQLPVSGIIKTRFSEPDLFGAASKGMSIEARGGALVVAPIGGIVRFAGYFKNYGNIIILEHKNGYHSLIAGLEKLDTVIGQNISAGEPIGILHHAQAGGRPVLYYELRFNGKPVDPSEKFSDLG